MDVGKLYCHAGQCSEDAGERRQAEQEAVHLITVGTAAYNVHDGQPDEMRKQHHPRDERGSQAQENFGESHVPTMLIALIIFDQELLKLAGTVIEDFEPFEKLFPGIASVGEQVGFAHGVVFIVDVRAG